MTITLSELTRLSEETGISVNQIRVREVDWSQYLQQGLTVKLTVHQFITASKTTLEDLGIRPADQAEADAIKRTQILGYNRLVPKRIVDQMNELISEGRSNLKRFSFNTSEWGRLVPLKSYRAWSARNDQLKRAYLDLADEIYNSWDDLVREQEVELLIVGRANYRRLLGAGVPLDMTIERFSSDFAIRKLARLQPRSVARSEMSWEWSTEYLPINDAVAATLEAMLSSSDPATRDRGLTIQRQQAGGLEQLAVELTGELRTMVYNAVADCLTGMRKNNNELPRNSTSQLRRLFDKIERLKFWPDAELEEKIGELKGLIEVSPDLRSDADVKRVLTDLGSEMQSYLLEIDRPPERDLNDVLFGEALELGAPASRQEPESLDQNQPIDLGEARERQMAEAF